MLRTATLVSLLATLAVTGTVAVACVQPPDESGDDGVAQPKDDSGKLEDVGTAEQALITCPSGQYPFRKGVDFKYTWNYKGFVFKIAYDDVKHTIKYTNASNDGTFSATGVVSHWNRCPAGNENVVLTRSDGVVQSCTHVCLPDGREELHCPNAQLVMTVTAQNDVCVTFPRPFGQKNSGEFRGKPCHMTKGEEANECHHAFRNNGCEEACEKCWVWQCDPDVADEPDDNKFWECVNSTDPDYYQDASGIHDGSLPPGWCESSPEAYNVPDWWDPCTPPTGYENTSWCDPWTV